MSVLERLLGRIEPGAAGDTAPLTDPTLLRRFGVAVEAEVLDVVVRPSISASLVDPGCVCRLKLAVTGPRSDVYEALVRQRSSRRTAAEVFVPGRTVPAWADPMAPWMVAIETTAPS